VVASEKTFGVEAEPRHVGKRESSGGTIEGARGEVVGGGVHPVNDEVEENFGIRPKKFATRGKRAILFVRQNMTSGIWRIFPNGDMLATRTGNAKSENNEEGEKREEPGRHGVLPFSFLRPHLTNENVAYDFCDHLADSLAGERRTKEDPLILWREWDVLRHV
jgi:hypothetical protein